MTLPVFLGLVTGVSVGDSVVVGGGLGTSATCEVTETSKSTLVASVSSVAVTSAPTPHVTVVQAIPKGDRAELAVEVLTEIGVDRIVPWAASRSVGVWRGERASKSLAKWRSTAREAGKQSRRSWLPEVTPMASLTEVVALVGEADLAVVLHEGAAGPLSSLSLEGVGSVLVVVGPEGGVTDEELSELGAGRVVRIGESVLRTSTAGVAAVAALLSRTSRWARPPPTVA